VVRRRSASRTATPAKTIGAAEVLRLASDESCSAKEETQHYKLKFSAEPPLYGEVSKTYKKNTGTMADIHISGTMAHTSTIQARRPSTT
jgi:hypothetical protein